MIKLATLAAAPLLTLPLLVTLERAAADREAVERAVEDYVEALYDVKPELSERSVHPALQKLGCWRPDGADAYGTPGVMTFEQLRDLAGHWNKDGRELTYDIQLLDVLDVTASAKLTADWGVDHMHLIKRDGQWKIVQILWQSHPPKG
jgi:hypothetical protein